MLIWCSDRFVNCESTLDQNYSMFFLECTKRNLYISAPEHRSQVGIALLERARKTIFCMFFSDISIHHEISLPHRQQKHWNLQHPEIGHLILLLKKIRRFSRSNKKQLWRLPMIFWTNIRINLCHYLVSPTIVNNLICWTFRHFFERRITLPIFGCWRFQCFCLRCGRAISWRMVISEKAYKK